MNAIVKLSSLGDIIHSLIVLPKLNEKIDFVVDKSFKEVLEYNPYINKVIPVKLREAKRNKSLIFSIYKDLKKLNYDNVYDLQGLLKSALVSKIIGKNIIGYANPREKVASLFYNKKIKSTSNIATAKYLELVGVEDLEYLKNHPKLLFFKDKKFDFLSEDKKNIVFIIGGAWRCKKTPLKVWAELANYLKNENIIVPFYGEEEKKDALFIANNSKNVTMVSLNLNDLKALISKADLLIGNDTGPSFIAWANNINNIILYGCTYSNKILENKFSKSVEIQKGIISKKLFNMDKMDVKKIIKIIDEF
ncbi:MAG TPA: lipopolysaccharide heptosyltransferase I [Nautiliaceae bacterium]|nr:lipopolysaccharide heptosyltransferase I [Nautiliaceae bacterium]